MAERKPSPKAAQVAEESSAQKRVTTKKATPKAAVAAAASASTARRKGRATATDNPHKHRDIGLDVPFPPARCSDVDCPFCGTLPVHGSVITGVVSSAKMQHTVVVTRERLWRVPKFERYEKRTSRIPAHCPPCLGVQEGDVVTIAECRPLSKTVAYVVVARHQGN